MSSCLLSPAVEQLCVCVTAEMATVYHPWLGIDGKTLTFRPPKSKPCVEVVDKGSEWTATGRSVCLNSLLLELDENDISHAYSLGLWYNTITTIGQSLEIVCIILQ